MYRFMQNQMLFLFSTVVLFFSAYSHANMGVVPYGLGMYAAMQGCGMNYGTASGSHSVSDSERNMMKRIEKLELSKEKLENKKDSHENKLRRHKKTINDYFVSDFADLIINHIDSGRTCFSYKGFSQTLRPDTLPEPTETIPQPFVEVFLGGSAPSSGKPARCSLTTSGLVSDSICNETSVKQDSRKKVSLDLCKRAVREYYEFDRQKQKDAVEIEEIQAEIEELEYSLEEKEEERLAKAESRRTQGGVCLNCGTAGGSASGGVNLAYTGANLLTALVAGYAGYQQDKRVVQANAQLGFPTNPGSSYISYGFPFLMNGIYGALGGQAGAGGIGCAGGIGGGGYPYGPGGMMGNPYGYGPMGNMGGALGYPTDMFGNPIGGGMYMPGQGTWGANGPYGASPYGPHGPYGFMVNGVGAIGGGGYMMNGPIGGIGALGGPIGGPLGGGGYMMNGPIGGVGALGGLIGGPLGGGGYMMNGPIGGVGALGGAGALGGPQASLQMLQLQQQMAQQQMQLQQQMMQAQMQAQQQYLVQQQQRQQQVSALYTELNSLVYRIQAIQTGAGGLSGSLTGGVGGYGGIGIGGAISIGGAIGIGAAPTPGLPYGSAGNFQYYGNTPGYPYGGSPYPYPTNPGATIPGRGR